jgi:predicted PurR-regulated permease PerM
MFLTLRLLGVPYALALGLFVGVVAAFIPIVGTYIAGAVPVLVALAAVSLTAAGAAVDGHRRRRPPGGGALSHGRCLAG